MKWPGARPVSGHHRGSIGGGSGDSMTFMDKLAGVVLGAGGSCRKSAEEARRICSWSPRPSSIRDRRSYNHLGDDEPVALPLRSGHRGRPGLRQLCGPTGHIHQRGGEFGALLDAVRRCWASLWTDRAVSYRNANGIDHRSVALAVVVQRMIDAAAAGVMFTANPITGSRNETVIDASPGLGEAVVSGAVNPDHFVVNSVDRRIVSRRLGDKRIMITSTPGGGTEHHELADQSSEACLDDDQVLRLVILASRCSGCTGRRRI